MIKPLATPLYTIIRLEKTLIRVMSSGTVKPVLSGHSKIDKTKILMTNGSLI